MSHRNERSVPEWARESAFPQSPGGWGWLSEKGRRHELASEQELIEAIRGDRSASVSLIWTPDHDFMIMPEEWELASDAVISSRRVRAELGLVEARKWSLILGLGVTASPKPMSA